MRRDIHDREDQEKMILFKAVLARVRKGRGNRALPRMYRVGFKNGYLPSKENLDSNGL